MRSKTIEVPLPLVVACARDGVTIHPGGYRLSPNALKKQGALSRDLEAIVRNHAIIDPSIRPKPRIEFLIEPGGTETYAEARKHGHLRQEGKTYVVQDGDCLNILFNV